MNKKIAVTGLSIIHQLGFDADTAYEKLNQSEGAIVNEQCVVALPELNAEDYLNEDRVRRIDHASQILAVCVKKLVNQIESPVMDDLTKVGMCTSTTLGTIDSLMKFSTRIFKSGPSRANPMEFPNTVLNASAGHACIETGLRGHNETIASSGSLGEAYDALLFNRANAMVAAGMDEASVYHQQVHKERLNSISTPLTEDNRGYFLGEGAAALFLEQSDNVAADKVFAWYKGYASTFDAVDFKSNDNDAEQLIRVMQLALEHADVAVDAIDGLVLSYEGCSVSDKRMAKALASVFSDLSSTPLFVPSGRFGNMEGANESYGAFCTCQILKHGQWPASPWMEQHEVLSSFNIPAVSQTFSGDNIMLVVTDRFGLNQCHIFSKAR